MRIIAGVAKGRTLAAVAQVTRPTSDRAREALFSTLMSEFTNFDGLNFLDLFSGTGAIALEALSRGAACVHAVEKNSSATEVINKNFELVKQAEPIGTFHLYSMSAQKFLTEGVHEIKYHVVYVDPPYDFPNKDLTELLSALLPHLHPIALIAVERDSKSARPQWPTGYVEQREKNYGQASIYYAGVAAQG